MNGPEEHPTTPVWADRLADAGGPAPWFERFVRWGRRQRLLGPDARQWLRDLAEEPGGLLPRLKTATQRGPGDETQRLRDALRARLTEPAPPAGNAQETLCPPFARLLELYRGTPPERLAATQGLSPAEARRDLDAARALLEEHRRRCRLNQQPAGPEPRAVGPELPDPPPGLNGRAFDAAGRPRPWLETALRFGLNHPQRFCRRTAQAWLEALTGPAAGPGPLRRLFSQTPAGLPHGKPEIHNPHLRAILEAFCAAPPPQTGSGAAAGAGPEGIEGPALEAFQRQARETLALDRANRRYNARLKTPGSAGGPPPPPEP